MAKRQQKKGVGFRAMRTGNLKAEVSTREIDNPTFNDAHEIGRLGNVKRITAFVNVRESAVSVLASKGQVSESQVAAADRFRRLFEAMGGAGARAMDPSKEFVDGGRIPDPISAHQIDAGKELADAYAQVSKQHGLYAWRLLGYVCGEGRSIHELTTTRRQRDTMTDLLRLYLDCLSEHWGYSTRAQRTRLVG